MKRLFRTLLFWLMIAVLPLHAAAAIVGMPCSNMHGNAAPAVVEHHSDAAMETHDHAAPEHHQEALASHSAGDDGSHSSCSACSVFCAAPAVPATAHITVPDYDGSETLLVTPATLGAGFIPERLRRPPRSRSV